MTLLLELLDGLGRGLVRLTELVGAPAWAVWVVPVLLAAAGYMRLRPRPMAQDDARRRQRVRSPVQERREVLASLTPTTTYNPKAEACDQWGKLAIASRQPFRILIDGYDGAESSETGALRYRVWADVGIVESLRTLTKDIRVQVEDNTTVTGDPVAIENQESA